MMSPAPTDPKFVPTSPTIRKPTEPQLIRSKLT